MRKPDERSTMQKILSLVRETEVAVRRARAALYNLRSGIEARMISIETQLELIDEADDALTTLVDL